MTGGGDDDVGSDLAALDELPVRDQWAEIVGRARGDAVVVDMQARRPARRRSRISRVLVAVATAAALIAVGLVVGRTTSPSPSVPTIRPDHPPAIWTLGPSAPIPGIGPGTLPLIGTSAGAVVVTRRGGNAVTVVDRQGSLREVPVDGEVRAVAAGSDADGVRFAAVLTRDGSLWRVGAAGPAIAVAKLGATRSSRPSLAVSGGRVFVAGGGSDRLVAVDSSGAVRTVPADGLRPRLLTSHGDDVWALDPTSGRLVRISGSSRRVTGAATVRGVSLMTAGAKGLYLFRPAAAALMLVDSELRVKRLARVEALTTAISANSRDVWSAADGVLTAYSADDGRLDGVVVLPSRRYAALTSDGASTWQMNFESGLSRLQRVP